MNILEILKEYWKPITGFLGLIIGFILQRISKRPNQVIDTTSTFLYSYIPECIKLTERQTEIKGSLKKEYCLKLVEDWFKQNNLEFTPYYRGIASTYIEEVLSCPQSHEKKSYNFDK